MEIPVIRNNTVYIYRVRPDVPAGWLPNHSFQAASLYATLCSKGVSSSEAAALAELYIFKHLFEGIQFDTSLEAKVQSFLC